MWEKIKKWWGRKIKEAKTNIRLFKEGFCLFFREFFISYLIIELFVWISLSLLDKETLTLKNLMGHITTIAISFIMLSLLFGFVITNINSFKKLLRENAKKILWLEERMDMFSYLKEESIRKELDYGYKESLSKKSTKRKIREEICVVLDMSTKEESCDMEFDKRYELGDLKEAFIMEKNKIEKEVSASKGSKEILLSSLILAIVVSIISRHFDNDLLNLENTNIPFTFEMVLFFIYGAFISVIVYYSINIFIAESTEDTYRLHLINKSIEVVEELEEELDK